MAKDTQYTISESIHGNFFYHIAVDGKALCGEKITMSTSIPFSYWGKKGHLNERYCKKCEKEHEKI